MATIQFEDTEIECEDGALLREVLLDAGHPHTTALRDCSTATGLLPVAPVPSRWRVR
jgi:hypothetical protein